MFQGERKGGGIETHYLLPLFPFSFVLVPYVVLGVYICSMYGGRHARPWECVRIIFVGLCIVCTLRPLRVSASVHACVLLAAILAHSDHVLCLPP